VQEVRCDRDGNEPQCSYSLAGGGGEQNDSFHLGCQIFGLRSRRC